MVFFRLTKLPSDGSKSDRLQTTKRVRKRQRNMDPKRMVYTPHIVAVNQAKSLFIHLFMIHFMILLVVRTIRRQIIGRFVNKELKGCGRKYSCNIFRYKLAICLEGLKGRLPQEQQHKKNLREFMKMRTFQISYRILKLGACVLRNWI
jgi:hypothetical protein